MEKKKTPQTHFCDDVISLIGNTAQSQTHSICRKMWRTVQAHPERHAVPSEELKTMFLKDLLVT